MEIEFLKEAYNLYKYITELEDLINGKSKVGDNFVIQGIKYMSKNNFIDWTLYMPDEEIQLLKDFLRERVGVLKERLEKL